MPTPERNVSERNGGLARIKTAMIEKKMTQAELADAADCHEKTIQNLMNGRAVRDQTLFDVCMVLGLDFDTIKASWSGPAVAAGVTQAPAVPAPAAQTPRREDPGQPALTAGAAPVYMGAYTRAAVDQYIASYLTVRPSFTVAGGITAYRTDISWDDSWPSLVFEERDRADAPYSHRGRLYVPASSMFIHLVSLTKGSMRTVLLSQLDMTGRMRGIVTTLNKQKALLMPVAAPIVYVRAETFEPDCFGEIGKDRPHHAAYCEMLEETTSQGYARLIGS
jgi:transcriptional regulator with XRE-family HTH domain